MLPPDLRQLQCLPVLIISLNGDWLPMHVKDVGILNVGLYTRVYSILSDLLKCINASESGHTDCIFIPWVLCTKRMKHFKLTRL